MIIYKISLSILFSFFCFHCAKTIPPSGGTTEQPSFYLKSTSLTDLSVNVPKDISFKIKFSDWVNPSIQNQDIIINPSTKQKLKISTSGSSLKISPRDPLLPNTTYNLAFRSSLKSVNQQKLVINENLIFSTGDSIDQGNLHGHIQSSNPQTTYLGLYPHQVTPAISNIVLAPNHTQKTKFPHIHTERPYYTIPVDSNGNFDYQGVKPGFYSVLAFVDLNQNLRPEIETEQIGVGAKSVWIDHHSSFFSLNTSKIIQEPIQINSVEWLPLEENQAPTSQGVLKITFNQPVLKTSFNPTIQDSLKEKSSYSKVNWYDNNQKVFITLDQAISKNKTYQVNLEKLFSLSYQPLDSSQQSLYFTYDPLFFEQPTTYTPENFKWKQKHFPSHFRFIFESNYHLSNLHFSKLKKNLSSTLDTLEAPLFWRKLSPFHFEVVIKKQKEENQKLTFSLSTPDTLNPESPQVENLGFVQLKETDLQGFIEVRLPTKIQSQNQSAWKYQIIAKNNQRTTIDTIPSESFNSLLDTLGPFDIGSYSLAIFYDNNANGLIDAGSLEPWFAQETFVNLSKNAKVTADSIVSIQLENSQ